MKIIFATFNLGKLKEIKRILPEFKIVSLADLKIDQDIIEDGETFAANALVKARLVASKTGGWVLADDSGLCIKALNNAPGIRSARWAASDEDKINLVLAKMKNIPDKKRQAYMEAAIALVAPDKREWIFSGRVDGVITKEPRGINRPQLPYDLIFQPSGAIRTFAEMSNDEKNKISHRGQALQKLKEFLRKERL